LLVVVGGDQRDADAGIQALGEKLANPMPVDLAA